ncbi:MAG TPA: cell division protein SepF [Actinomycetes bacterium]|nr:cell division protein SepF [Actinomycetes bacterium]
MASAMRKMAVYLGLVEDESRYEDYDEFDDYDEVEESSSRTTRDTTGRGREATARSVTALRDEPRGVVALADRAERAERPTNRPPTTARPRIAGGPDGPRITTLHPRTYNEARQIGEHFRDGTPVIMNLTEMDDVDAKRLVDFAAGLVFGLHGTIERVTAKVFLLSPADVEVAAEDKARIAENGFFNQS